MHLAARITAVVFLALYLLGAVPASASPRNTVTSGWQAIAYTGATISRGSGPSSGHISSYSLSYPVSWRTRQWPDTLADYGQLHLTAPSGTTVDLVLLPLRAHGPTLKDVIAHDAAYLSRPIRNRVVLPAGSAVRLSGTPIGSNWVRQILYLQTHRVVYRLFFSEPPGAGEGKLLRQVAATLQIPATPGTATHLPPQVQPSGSSCCHCPAWGVGWGTVLTSIDRIPVFANAGNVDNGCNGSYGILYQCVELAQRYFAQRWGYPAIWSGVEAAADMPVHHPAGIEFTPNGGSSGPQEGDALVFYGGGFGHVALVQRVDRHSGEITLVEENWSATGVTHLPIYADNTVAIRNSTYGSYIVAGWLHSALNTPGSHQS